MGQESRAAAFCGGSFDGLQNVVLLARPDSTRSVATAQRDAILERASSADRLARLLALFVLAREFVPCCRGKPGKVHLAPAELNRIQERYS